MRVRALRASDLSPESRRLACQFFERYDSLEHRPLEAAYRIGSELGLDRGQVFRWLRFVRPACRAVGYDWPQEEPPAGLETTDGWRVASDGRLVRADGLDEEEPGEELEELRQELRRRLEAHQEPLPSDEHFYDPRTPEQVAAESTDAQAVGLVAEMAVVPRVERLDSPLYYDEQRDAYIVYLRPRRPPLVIPRETDRWMRRAYSRWCGYPMRVELIATAVGMTVEEFSRYRSLRGWRRDMNPLDARETVYMDRQSLEEELARLEEVSLRRHMLFDRLSKLEQDARKWRELEVSLVEAVRGALADVASFRPAAPVHPAEDEGEHVLILPLNDWQIGARAPAEEQRFGGEFSLSVAERLVEDYLRQLRAYVERQRVRWGVPRLVLLGDLLHGLTGTTVHGTALHRYMDAFDWDQFRAAMRLLVRVADEVMRIFGRARIIALPGNHDGALGQVMGELLFQRYRNVLSEEDVAIGAGRTHYEMVGASLFVFDHGASPSSGVSGGRIPRKRRYYEVSVKDLVLARPDLVAEVRRRGGGIYFVMGDQHYALDEQMTHVEMIKLPALVTGDVYADHNGWYSRAAQAVLLVGPRGLCHMERFYLSP